MTKSKSFALKKPVFFQRIKLAKALYLLFGFRSSYFCLHLAEVIKRGRTTYQPADVYRGGWCFM